MSAVTLPHRLSSDLCPFKQRREVQRSVVANVLQGKGKHLIKFAENLRFLDEETVEPARVTIEQFYCLSDEQHSIQELVAKAIKLPDSLSQGPDRAKMLRMEFVDWGSEGQKR
jgi:hypothetical protein